MAITEDDVKALVDTNRDVAPFIADAGLIVSENLSGKGLSAGRLDLIHKYLAAHFVTLVEERGGLSRFKMGDASEEYAIQKGMGFAQTRYGQNALDLDTTGTLKGITSTDRKAEFRVV